jgi:hypothetical protein
VLSTSFTKKFLSINWCLLYGNNGGRELLDGNNTAALSSPTLGALLFGHASKSSTHGYLSQFGGFMDTTK